MLFKQKLTKKNSSHVIQQNSGKNCPSHWSAMNLLQKMWNMCVFFPIKKSFIHLHPPQQGHLATLAYWRWRSLALAVFRRIQKKPSGNCHPWNSRTLKLKMDGLDWCFSCSNGMIFRWTTVNHVGFQECIPFLLISLCNRPWVVCRCFCSISKISKHAFSRLPCWFSVQG